MCCNIFQHTDLLSLVCNPFLLVSLCWRRFTNRSKPPLVNLQKLPHCWKKKKSLQCDRVKTLSCLGALWEDGFNEQTGAWAAGHISEAVMETPLYTLQIKAKPCKCFSTHFQETGRDGPRHQPSLVSCECFKIKTGALRTQFSSQQTDQGGWYFLLEVLYRLD